MSAQVGTEFTDFIKIFSANRSIQGMTNTIKKVDVLHYYRETKLAFLNLGSLLISQTDGRFFIFNHKGELVGIDRIKL